MRNLITNNLEKCVGCNRCIRRCPVPEANVAHAEEGATKVHIDSAKCIACGACLAACRHGSRDFVDDTEKFFDDLRHGTPISLFFAPASLSNLENWGRILTLLRNRGVRKIYAVALGADICTWANIRYIQKNKPVSAISPACPVIVNYVLKHRQELVPYLSPVYSPMLCTAVYMRKYQGITDKLAALSPCVAKAGEFEDTDGLVSYNVTFLKLEKYIRENHLVLPEKESGLDLLDTALGSVYPMPGGFKENVEFMLGKDLRIDKCEGQGVVYRMLDAFANENKENLPAVFDVLNCPEGCNQGTACDHDKSFFAVNKAMDTARRNAVKGREREYFEELYRTYDKTFKLADFLRRYHPKPVRRIPASAEAIEDAFRQLGKLDEISRSFDCGACGSDSCRDMAVRIAKKINFPDNCIQKAHEEIKNEHIQALSWQEQNATSIRAFQQDIASINDHAGIILNNMSNVTTVMGVYDATAQEISKIASNIHMISLNASIEAARAGEYGRSFAVVAEAIRSLAGETQKATTKISQASLGAKKAITGISEMLVSIGTDITKSHDDISRITDSTREKLKSAPSDPDGSGS
jgi:Na+-translocating ferredoxin:NAD+ oxidoreductase RNF subunit RnfB